MTLKRDFDAPSITEATRAPYPTSVSSFVARSLARNREDRFATAKVMLEAWRGVFAASGWTAPTITLGGTSEDGGDTTATMTRPKRKP